MWLQLCHILVSTSQIFLEAIKKELYQTKNLILCSITWNLIQTLESLILKILVLRKSFENHRALENPFPTSYLGVYSWGVCSNGSPVHESILLEKKKCHIHGATCKSVHESSGLSWRYRILVYGLRPDASWIYWCYYTLCLV